MDSFLISFKKCSCDEANQHAIELTEQLRDLAENIVVSQVRENSDAQDLGTAVQVAQVVLGSASALAIANGIAGYLKRGRGEIEISKNGTVVAKNLNSGDVAKIAAAFGKPE
jgi:hypothetical protein